MKCVHDWIERSPDTPILSVHYSYWICRCGEATIHRPLNVMKPESPVIPDRHDLAVHEIVMAKDQPEYDPLPVYPLEGGIRLSRWTLSEDDLKRINETGDVYLYVWTFNQPHQPVMLTTEPPEMSIPEDKDWPGLIEERK